MKSRDQMIEALHQHARRILIGHADEQLAPFFHIQFKNRDSILPAPFSGEREKSAFLHALRATLKAFRSEVVNYAGISEAWTAEYDHEPGEADLMPSERETRKECVVVTAGDRRGATLRMWEIIRDGKGAVTDLVEQKAPDRLEGRMHNLMAGD